MSDYGVSRVGNHQKHACGGDRPHGNHWREPLFGIGLPYCHCAFFGVSGITTMACGLVFLALDGHPCVWRATDDIFSKKGLRSNSSPHTRAEQHFSNVDLYRYFLFCWGSNVGFFRSVPAVLLYLPVSADRFRLFHDRCHSAFPS